MPFASSLRLFALLLGVVGCLKASDPSDASTDGRSACVEDRDCDDGRFCTGTERCAPTEPGADSRGCVVVPVACAVCDALADRCTVDCAVDADVDGDGHDAVECGGDDCDDADARVSPSASELCDPEGVDEDCDPSTFGARDADGDRVIDATCCNGPRCGSDCDDTIASVGPGASEVCNGADDDCDGVSDEGIERTRYFPDADADGYGARGAEGVLACARPEGLADAALDCDDSSADVSPVAAEQCNGRDDDCDGAIDELEGNTFFRDSDDDGWGDPDVTMSLDGCVAPDGYVARSGDCDDTRADTYPGAPERCNGVDDDCSATDVPGGPDSREDADGDAHAPLDAVCEGGFPRDDCDDTRAVTFFGAAELCSGLDEDCDGRVDEGADVQCRSGTCEAGCLDRRPLAMSGGAVCALDEGVPHCWGEAARLVVDQANLVLGVDALAEPTPVALPVSSARSIATSTTFACAVLEDATVRCWGGNEDGELGVGDRAPRAVPVSPLGLTGIVQVALGASTACALSARGEVRCWGRGEDYELGDGGDVSRSSPGLVPGLDRVVELVARSSTFCARRYDGGVWCWGRSPVGDGTSGGAPIPRRVLEGAHALVAGASSALGSVGARRDDGWWCWGAGLAFDVSGGTNVRIPVPLRAVEEEPRDLAIGGATGCALRSDRSVVCWGAVESLAPEPLVNVSRVFPATVTALPAADSLACGDLGCCVVSDGELRCRGRGNALFFGDGEPRAFGPVDAFGLHDARSIALGGLSDSACAADSSGGLRCFGVSSNQLGFDPLSRSVVYVEPVAVPGAPSDVVEARSSEDFTCARTGAGAVWCWGGDALPGDGSLAQTIAPREVDARAMGPVNAIEVGLDFACALAADGRAWCWGATGTRSALCGAGDATTRCETPVAVAGGHAFEQLRAGRSHACGVTSSGEVWCWGARGNGALGDGLTVGFASEPVRSGGFDDATDVALGANHTCVLEDGRVHCVGFGTYGQLGRGSTATSSTFASVVDLDDATALRCNHYTCFARRTSGGWVAWGNDNGLLGAAVRTLQSNVPVPAAHGSTSEELWLGRRSACARRDRGLACWGLAGAWEQRALPASSVRPAF
jgi:alpha-tubulin suppressor-like RCC1 family protein